ncbi:MAG: hypothetical protein R6W71_06775 [Bacteroidales bacterium]
MNIGPDGRIIRRELRRFTPVNTERPSEKTGFLTGFFSVVLVAAIVMLGFIFIGWFGGLFIKWSWWNYKTFMSIGGVVNLIFFPAYISGALEGLASRHFKSYRLYSFLYGVLAIAIPIFISQISGGDFNAWTYLWALAYGGYSDWFARKMI